MFTLGEYRFAVATTAREIEAAHRLRYKVYVENYQFLREADNPGGLEKDDWDACSVPFVAVRAQGQAVGTVRLIQNSPLGLPVLKLCEAFYKDKNPRSPRIAEISRLSVDPELRGKMRGHGAQMDYYFHKLSRPDGQVETAPKLDRRAVVLLGLIQVLSQVADSLDITHLYIVAEKRLMALLQRQGIVFHQIGPEIDHHGLRAPFVGLASQLASVTLPLRNRLAQSMDPPQKTVPVRIDRFGMGAYRFRLAKTAEDRSSAVELRRRCHRGLGYSGPDLHDEHAHHLLAEDSVGRLVGTLRIVPNSPLGLPALELADPHAQQTFGASSKIADLSGLAVEDLGSTDRHQRRSTLVLLGLFQMATDLASNLRLTKLLSAMDQTIAILLARNGIAIERLGGPVQEGPHPFLLRVSSDGQMRVNCRTAQALTHHIRLHT